MVGEVLTDTSARDALNEAGVQKIPGQDVVKIVINGPAVGKAIVGLTGRAGDPVVLNKDEVKLLAPDGGEAIRDGELVKGAYYQISGFKNLEALAGLGVIFSGSSKYLSNQKTV